MSLITITLEGNRWTVPLAASTILGRHWSCDVVLPNRGVPLRWVEIRWWGDGWAWRALTSVLETRGTGGLVRDEWRRLSAGKGRIRLDGLGEALTVELISDESPVFFLKNIHQGFYVQGDDLDSMVRFDEFRCHYYQAQGEASVRPIADGDVLSFDGALYRAYVPVRVFDTLRPKLNLADRAVSLEVDNATRTATFYDDRGQITVTGECVGVLAVYAQAVLRGLPWLNTDDAYQMWTAAGGSKTSPMDRLAWERGKLRTQLRKSGAVGVADLFQSRRRGHMTETCLTLQSDQLVVNT